MKQTSHTCDRNKCEKLASVVGIQVCIGSSPGPSCGTDYHYAIFDLCGDDAKELVQIIMNGSLRIPADLDNKEKLKRFGIDTTLIYNI